LLALDLRIVLNRCMRPIAAPVTASWSGPEGYRTPWA